MGIAQRDAHVRVGLVGIPTNVSHRIAERLRRRGDDDAGRFEVIEFADVSAWTRALEEGRISAICIWLRVMAPSDFITFIVNLRQTKPTVPICLVGETTELDDMPGFHPAWRHRFSHYYRIAVDTDQFEANEAFNEGVGLIRDLLFADEIKLRAMGHYVTVPGKVLTVKYKQPIGFWLIIGATLLAATISATVNPLLSYKLRNSENAITPAPGSSNSRNP